MKKVVIVCGLIAGIIVSTIMGFSMAAYHDNPNAMGTNGMLIGYASMLLALSLVFVGIRNFRDKYNNGVISFGQAFKIGLLISFIASTVYVITWYIQYHFFLPDFMDSYTAHALKQAQKSGASAAKMKAPAADMADAREKYKNPLWFILYTYAEILPVGLIVSLVSALILRRREDRSRIVVPN